MSTACLEDETIAAWAAGVLAPDERDRAIEHAASCATCRLLVAHVFSVTAPTPARLGRYEIRGPLGAGGMGVVLRAHDPTLGREVALKMIQATLVDPAHRERMLREAQALAKISHPNVVTVHELGEAGDEVFVAMELVTGTMLHRWLAERPRSRAARVAVVLGIGRGIAAVHAAGLLHRDIKPDNILVRDDGSAVLVDFGLARLSTAAPALGAGSGFAGTPDYVAPEVAAGRPATAASDQYQWWTIAREVLGTLPRVVARGHDPDPARRFPSMDAAVRALEHALRRRWRWLALAAAAAVAALAVAGFVLLRSPEPVATCELADPPRWSIYQRILIERGLRDAGIATAKVLGALDRRVATMRDLRAQACRDGDARRAEWARRLACLDESWSKAAGTFDKLATARTAHGAVDELAAVLPAERCGQGSLPAIPEKGPPEIHQRYTELVRTFQDIEMNTKLRPAERTAKLRALEPEVKRLHYGPLEARWHWSLGHTLGDAFDADAGAREMDLAAQTALAAGEDEVYVSALITELRMTSTAASADRVAQIENAATAGARRLGNPHVDADLFNARGLLHMERGDYQQARTLYEQADAKYTEASLAAEPMHVSVLQNLGAICVETGDLTAADRFLDRAVELARQRYGDGAPYWEARAARASSILFRNQLVKAEAELRAAVAGLTRIAPVTHQLGQMQTFLCVALLGQKKHADARAACGDAIASLARSVGGTSAALVFPLALAAQVELHDNAPAAALPLARKASEIAHAAHVRPVELATADVYYAIALHGTGHRAEARAIAVKVAPLVRGPEMEEGRKDLLRAFPDLRAVASPAR